MASVRAIGAAVIAGVMALLAVGCGGDDGQIGHARAVLTGPGGVAMGAVMFTQGPHGVLVSADLRRLAHGAHGFHIHETGSCTPDFGAAGDHFNSPAGRDSPATLVEHGFLNPAGVHAGDLPNLYAGADGVARADYFATGFTLDSGDVGLFDPDGAAVIVHARPDTYGAAPGAGDRVACGVIEPN